MLALFIVACYHYIHNAETQLLVCLFFVHNRVVHNELKRLFMFFFVSRRTSDVHIRTSLAEWRTLYTTAAGCIFTRRHGTARRDTCLAYQQSYNNDQSRHVPRTPARTRTARQRPVELAALDSLNIIYTQPRRCQRLHTASDCTDKRRAFAAFAQRPPSSTPTTVLVYTHFGSSASRTYLTMVVNLGAASAADGSLRGGAMATHGDSSCIQGHLLRRSSM